MHSLVAVHLIHHSYEDGTSETAHKHPGSRSLERDLCSLFLDNADQRIIYTFGSSIIVHSTAP
jgi:hypothetical protein